MVGGHPGRENPGVGASASEAAPQLSYQSGGALCFCPMTPRTQPAAAPLPAAPWPLDNPRRAILTEHGRALIRQATKHARHAPIRPFERFRLALELLVSARP